MALDGLSSIVPLPVLIPAPLFAQTRLEIVEFLKGKGLFRGTADNAMRLGLCSRSKDVIEPVLKPQWWVNCKDMAAKSAQAVRDGTLEMIPKV
jgi:valyl-tRNA synthetase